ncbi:MAG: PadR family transcriptional regulator [Candidatus Omnitrophota bacterium]
MIGHELILLGLLKESPKHGYEIKKKIKNILALFAGIDLKSIYYPLRVLEKKGMVEKHVSKEGRRPKRFVYTLTSKGQNRFQELLSKSFLNFNRPQFSLDLSLYFLDDIESAIAKRRLRARTQVLKTLSATLAKTINSLRLKKSSSLVRILEHDLQMIEAESRFLSSLIKTL